jgi:HK97 family phage portal protein
VASSPACPGPVYNYGQDVHEGYDSNVVMAPVMWVMRTFTEARAVVESKTNKVWNEVEDHKAEILIDEPNDAYGGDELWKATCVSYVLNGNAYWRKVRNAFGDVLQLWYTPHWMMTPRYPQDGSQFISHYEYRPIGGPPIRIEKRDVIHFRFGLDPRNTRLGLSPLHALLREVFVDDEAAAFSAKILENMGVPGLMVSPKSESIRPPADDPDLSKLKASMKTAFSGDQRGDTMVMTVPTEVKQFGFDPNQLTLAALRNISEERVCAAIGIPTSVVGFGAGNESTGVGATMREQRRLAWVQCITPMQTTMGRQLTKQLLRPDFVTQTRRFRMRFDTTEVSAFQEEQDLTANRVATLVQAGMLRVDRGPGDGGLEVDDTQKVYLRPSNSVPIDENGKPIKEAVPAGAVDQRGQESLPAPISDRMNGRNGNSVPQD